MMLFLGWQSSKCVWFCRPISRGGWRPRARRGWPDKWYPTWVADSQKFVFLDDKVNKSGHVVLLEMIGVKIKLNTPHCWGPRNKWQCSMLHVQFSEMTKICECKLCKNKTVSNQTPVDWIKESHDTPEALLVWWSLWDTLDEPCVVSIWRIAFTLSVYIP